MVKVDQWIERFSALLMFVSLIVTVGVTLLQVIYRYVLNTSLVWGQEAVLITFVYTVLFGAVICVKHYDHLQVDLLENAPGWVQRFSRLLENIVTTAFIVVLLFYGGILFLDNLASGTTVATLPVEQAYVYLAIPLSAVLMLYFQVRRWVT
ncbi:TRAP-type C4-dicarboxylate transport system permease small subunit [Salsuginibacillus halophilus]|uniref:TRAP-type C4-dicarboxylate transport system permease small subunit n=1 Tax=Salsuginibacillus halophilus TaxID=517424 RepID=A0A2P8HQU9_9BACI|nr:TRAP transporter small permease subunit [Salsuginibacillus halophilus]PSL48597.1 TRAP-type C4-dicarboxylate transport system permease small subunit [Salsuginibacillus halophilus]